ncbi:MAG: hypothetical protein EPO28_00765 [Saprospiraceae bacterium]|nr:MAG: hypothetical protein EPO28_00765 [Saprospiraceae bacterium]
MKNPIFWTLSLLCCAFAFQAQQSLPARPATPVSVPQAVPICGGLAATGNVLENSSSPAPSSSPSPVAGDSGVIRGKVVYEGGEVRKLLNVIKDERTCGADDLVDESLLADANGGIKWAVVSISSEIKGGKSLDELPGDRVLDQSTCVYRPHVLLAGVNQEITINNMDHTLHNVRTASLMNSVVNKVQIYMPNMPHPSDKTTFKEPEVVNVLCDVHGWMKAYVHVVEHPYYAVTAADGSFEIGGVPPGKYTLHVWQEKLGEQDQQVEVTVGQAAEINFSYKTLK